MRISDRSSDGCSSDLVVEFTEDVLGTSKLKPSRIEPAHDGAIGDRDDVVSLATAVGSGKSSRFGLGDRIILRAARQGRLPSEEKLRVDEVFGLNAVEFFVEPGLELLPSRGR